MATVVKQVVADCPIIPNSGRIVVKRLEPKRKVRGIYIPDNAQENAALGVVCRVGHKVACPDLQECALVVFGKYAGTPVDVGGEWLVIREEEITGIVANGKLAEQLREEGA